MNVLVVLAIILFGLMYWIGRGKGIRSFIALFLNFAITFVTIILLTYRDAAISITLVACILISLINLFYINEITQKTKAAFYATLLTLGILLAVIFVVVHFSMTQGFGEEEVEELGMFSLQIGVNFEKIAMSMMIMGMIGAVTDTSIAIASSMNEVFFHHPAISRKALFCSGMSIGGDILGTTTNTLFFAFVGGYLALIIWVKDLNYSLGTLVNTKVFSSEVISVLCVGLGAILIIPITAWLTTRLLIKKTVK
ncbi:YibE/F family protein [Isobaculum melis]|uniref:YibE/F-like protein n=1 Tax=Isobaculum melis TaxID=142588 RepID=A0A1H9QDT3_9LACT|nr:YibE/F family protein [Isobaculum melis]SER58578.1 YibE/F-like protein [Isobaculum melis]